MVKEPEDLKLFSCDSFLLQNTSEVGTSRLPSVGLKSYQLLGQKNIKKLIGKNLQQWDSWIEKLNPITIDGVRRALPHVLLVSLAGIL